MREAFTIIGVVITFAFAVIGVSVVIAAVREGIKK